MRARGARGGAKIKFVKDDSRTPLTATEIKYLQQVLDTLLYYTSAINCTMLHAMSDIVMVVIKGTQAKKNCQKLYAL